MTCGESNPSPASMCKTTRACAPCLTSGASNRNNCRRKKTSRSWNAGSRPRKKRSSNAPGSSPLPKTKIKSRIPMLQNNPELKSKIDQLWNKFWSGGISNPLTAIEQITYLLFMKRLDELDQKKQADAEFTGEKYISKFAGKWIPPEYRAKSREGDTQVETDKKISDGKMYEIERRTLRWSEFKRMQAEDMLQHVQTKVF